MSISIDDAIKLLSKHYGIKVDILEEFIKQNKQINTTNTNMNTTNNEIDFIIPYCGVIYDDFCKAIVFNHGLYTQCTNKCDTDICKSCKNLKYGRIEQRLKLNPGELLVLENGKKETDYKNIIKKYKYDINELTMYFSKNNLNYKFDVEVNKNVSEKKGRGRPRKVTIDNDSPLYNVRRYETDNNDELVKEEPCSDDEDEIEVQEIDIDGIYYYLTSENVVLDKKSHKIVGLYKNGAIEKIKS